MEPTSELESEIEAVSSDADVKTMREELTEYGFKDEDLSKDEMSDLLKALRYSTSSAAEEESLRVSTKVKDTSISPESNHKLLRRYRTVADRRLPWCLLPSNLTPAQKVKCLSAYIRLLSINQYMRARSLSKFEMWATPVAIAAGGSMRGVCTRATRSGRSAPSYALIDDDDDEGDYFAPRKTRKRKISTSEPTTSNSESSLYFNKTFSLKRKTQKTECPKPEKESKTDGTSEVSVVDLESPERAGEDAGRTSGGVSNIISAICNSSRNGDASEEPLRSITARQSRT